MKFQHFKMSTNGFWYEINTVKNVKNVTFQSHKKALNTAHGEPSCVSRGTRQMVHIKMKLF